MYELLPCGEMRCILSRPPAVWRDGYRLEPMAGKQEQEQEEKEGEGGGSGCHREQG